LDERRDTVGHPGEHVVTEREVDGGRQVGHGKVRTPSTLLQGGVQLMQNAVSLPVQTAARSGHVHLGRQRVDEGRDQRVARDHVDDE
jgi:hypothetical protein